MWYLFRIPLRYGLKSPGTYFGPRLMQYEKVKNRNKGQRFFSLSLLLVNLYPIKTQNNIFNIIIKCSNINITINNDIAIFI